MKIQNILSFFRSLMPNFEKGSVIREVDAVFKELTDATMISLSLFNDDAVNQYKLNTKLASRINGLSYGDQKNLLKYLSEVSQKLSKQERFIKDMVEETFRDTIVKDGLDYQKVNVLRYISAIRFFNRYCRALTVAVVWTSREKNGFRMRPVDRIATEFVEDMDNQNIFVNLVPILAMPSKDFAKALHKLKGKHFDPAISDDLDGITSADPMKLGFLPPSWNPITFILSVGEDWQFASYETAKKELKMLRMEVLYLERQKDGASKEDLEQTQKLIDNIANDINKLEMKIEDYEEG